MKLFKSLLQQKRPLIGTFLQLPSPEVAEIFGFCGFDFVIIDNEHGVIGPAATLAMARAAEASGACAVIRTPDFEETHIKKALDVGPGALLCPGVQSAEDVRRVLRFSKYAPLGTRGACPGVRANYYGAEGASFYRRANEEVAILVQIEGAGAYREIDEILSIDGLDGILLGPVDLSMSLGHPGEVDHPEVVAAMEDIFSRAKAKGVAVATFAMDIASARMWVDRGVDFLAYHIDGMLLRESISAIPAALVV